MTNRADHLRERMTAPLANLVLVEDPRFYDDRQFAVYDRMRAEAPAYHYEQLNVFLLTRMDDIRYVSTHPEQFSNASGLTLNQLRMARDGAITAFERFNEPDGELVITKDPPRQRALRSLMSQNLTPRYLGGFTQALDGLCREVLERGRKRGAGRLRRRDRRPAAALRRRGAPWR